MTATGESLITLHPWWQAMTQERGPWARYRAFGGGMLVDADKKQWLPQGSQERDDSYKVRLSLAQDTGWTAPAIRRMRGTLTKDGPSIAHGQEVPAQLEEQLDTWTGNVDGCHTPLARWWSQTYSEVLRMGIDFVEIVRDPGDALTLADEPMPYLHQWTAEECVDWSVDRRGSLNWAVLRRYEAATAMPGQTAQPRTIIRLLTRTTGQQWVLEEIKQKDGKFTEQLVEDIPEWQHNLGVVPLVPRYAYRIAPMRGRSYIDEISAGDLQRMQLSGDQAMASYLHASPLLAISTRADLKEVGVGSSAYLKLPEGSTAEYLSLESGGMQIRETIIERIARESLNAAGIDPAGVATANGVAARASGAALAWSFSTSEEPTLNALVAEMDDADGRILEVVARYLTPGAPLPAHERRWMGTVTRPRRWDLLAPDQLIEQGIAAKALVPSETFARDIARQIADRLMPGADDQTRAQVREELDAAPFDDPAEALDPPADLSGSDDGEDTGELGERETEDQV